MKIATRISCSIQKQAQSFNFKKKNWNWLFKRKKTWKTVWTFNWPTPPPKGKNSTTCTYKITCFPSFFSRTPPPSTSKRIYPFKPLAWHLGNSLLYKNCGFPEKSYLFENWTESLSIVIISTKQQKQKLFNWYRHLKREEETDNFKNTKTEQKNKFC